jgi:hypothetical protein
LRSVFDHCVPSFCRFFQHNAFQGTRTSGELPLASRPHPVRKGASNPSAPGSFQQQRTAADTERHPAEQIPGFAAFGKDKQFFFDFSGKAG